MLEKKDRIIIYIHLKMWKKKEVEYNITKAIMGRERVYIDFMDIFYDTFEISRTRTYTAHLLFLEDAQKSSLH